MSKLPNALLVQFNNVYIRNNWAYPPKELLTTLGITFQEFIFFKWKKHREFQSVQNSERYGGDNVKTKKRPEWCGGRWRR